jgi:hypothetical protein
MARASSADQFELPRVAVAARRDALLTVGFVRCEDMLPTIMHVFRSSISIREQSRLRSRALPPVGHRQNWCKADLIITNSKFAARQILSVHPECEGRLVQSYEGLQHEQFNTTATPDETARLKAQFNLQPGYFLWVSNFYPYKQAELLIAGYARPDPHYGQNIHS